jgi:type VI secretion system VgrG family protein
MFAPANQPRFTLTFEGAQHDLKVLEFTGKEAISQPFRFELELVSERPDLDLESLLHCQAFLSFDAQGAGIHGQIYQVGQGDCGKRLTRYHVSLVPRLAYLAHRHNQRIFQQQSVPQIVAQILREHAILRDAFEFRLGSEYPPREYCVQYAESDLAFVQRLCAEVGIHYHFQHGTEGHLLVFGDDQTVFPRLAEPTVYLPGSGMAAGAPAIKRFNVRVETRTSVVTRRDYNFTRPRLQLEAQVDGEQRPVLEDYHFPGQFSDRESGRQLAQRALERHVADYRQAEGRSDESALVSGHFLQLNGHPRQDWNDLWLLTAIEHRGRQPQVLEETVTSDGESFQGYRNTFLATPWDVFFRPALGPEKPRMLGYQPAVVTGPQDSEIHCDEYGRVKVQLAWDRDGELNEHSSCWLRVATGWAHDRYGSVLIPRVGMEVLVGFIDADADKPLVVGCLPNAATPVPLDLPADKTRSIFRSQSSPGGGGYNELRIEDRKGAEEIYLRAQRNWTQHVLNDQQVQVDNQRSVVVTGLAKHELKADEQRITHGQRQTEVKQDDHLTVVGDRHIRVSNQATSASAQIHLSAGQQVVIDGGASATIQAGGQWINIGPGGIFSSVPIQVGGAPMAAMSAAPSVPGLPTKLAAAPAAMLTAAQIMSFKGDAPFCEECERCKDGICLAPSALINDPKPSVRPATSNVEPGFYIVEQGMSRSALESILFPQPDPAVLDKFRSLNPQLTQFAKPGQLIVLSDPRNTQCTREEALLMEAAQKVEAALAPMSDSEAEFMVRYQAEIQSFLSQGSTAVGIGSAMFSNHLDNLGKTLTELEVLHKQTFDKHGKLQGADFFSRRKQLMAQLDSSLSPLVRKAAGLPDHPNLKKTLGISSRSLVHHWNMAGVAGEIPGYATHIQGVSRASKIIKLGGWVGVGLGAAASGLKIRETCRLGTEEACRKVKFTETAKLAGAFGGSLGGGIAGTLVCVGIGLGTAGTGGVLCSLVMVGAGTFGGGVGGEILGEKVGEVIYEGVGK